MTPAAITLVQALYLVILYVPMRRFGLSRGMRVGMGYLIAQAIALLVSYAMDMAGWFSAPLAFFCWLSACAVLNLACLRQWRNDLRVVRSAKTGDNHRFPRFMLPALVLIILTAMIRLADPFCNVALSGTDSYQFVNFYTWILHHRLAIHDYPSGFALVTALAPWTLDPYEASRWSPHLVFMACLIAGSGLWQRIGGVRFAFLVTFLTGTSWFLYPITAYHPHFIQWTMVFVGLPALLCIYQRFLRQRNIIQTFLLGVLVNTVLAMTTAYFTLYLNLVLCGLTLIRGARRPGWTIASAAAMGTALSTPMVLAGYYGFLARCFFPHWQTGIQEQAALITDVSQQPLVGVNSLASPSSSSSLIQMVRSFLLPDWPLDISIRWIVYALLIILGLWMWRQFRRPRRMGIGLLAGLMIFSAVSAATHIAELPGWQGRNVFVTLYAGLAATLWVATHHAPGMFRKVLRSRPLTLTCLALLAGPSLVYPPMIGRNVPIAAVIRPRAIPSDNQVMTELRRAAGHANGKQTLVLVAPKGDAPDLIFNLLLFNRFTRESVFPGYRMTRTRGLDDLHGVDALLMPDTPKAAPLPSGFILHTRGPGYVFALREMPDSILSIRRETSLPIRITANALE